MQYILVTYESVFGAMQEEVVYVAIRTQIEVMTALNRVNYLITSHHSPNLSQTKCIHYILNGVVVAELYTNK